MGEETTIGKVRGLRPEHGGTSHWIDQRFTALSNLLLGAWFVTSLLLLPSLELPAVSEWLSKPIPGTAMILLIASTFYHARLGLQILIEDYVHDEGTHVALAVLIKIVAIAAATFGIFCVLKLALGGGLGGGIL